MKNNLLHRAAALLLVLSMLFALPSAAFAAEGDGTGSGDTTGSETGGGNTGGTGGDGTGDNTGGGTGGGTDTTTEPAITFTDKLKDGKLTLIMGSSVTLDDSYVKFENFPADVTYHWETADPQRVGLSSATAARPTLSPRGVTGNGQAVKVSVTATYNDAGERKELTKSFNVNVEYAKPDRITLSRLVMELNVNNDPAQASLTAIQLVDGTEETGLCDDSLLTWSVADPSILLLTQTHGATNRLSARKPGTTDVIVTVQKTNDQGETVTVSATCSVTVTGLLINQVRSGSTTDVTDQTITIPVGGEISLECQAIGSRFGGTTPVWESSSQGVASINSAGKVYAQAEGSTQIKVTRAGYVAFCTVLVVPNTVGSISTSISGDQTLALGSLQAKLDGAYQEAMYNAGISSTPGLSYVMNLSVSTAQGMLYYNYASPANPGYGVGGSEAYYVKPGAGNRALSGVTFVPNPGFSGEAVISYNGYDSNRNSFAGTIRVEVSDSRNVAYATQMNTPINFATDDFNSVHRDATGRDIRYVTFDLPDPKQGTLYYDYLGSGEYATLVTAEQRFGRVSSPYLDSVRFVPAQDFTGTVRITYHLTDTAYAVYTGSVSVSVSNQSGGTSTEIKYVAQRGEDQPFRVVDFNSLCQAVLGEGDSLDYLFFTALPDSSLGTLWYRYNSSSSRSRVSSATRYYRNNTSQRPGVGGVYFVPAETTVGVVTIPFMAYSYRGNRFQGTVSIQYNDVGEGELSFKIKASETVQFNAADFNEACLEATGTGFDYLRFNQLPDASTQGSLHANYYSAGSTGSRITNTNSQYYRTGSLSRVAFIPLTSFSGTVSIPFTAYKSDGSRVFAGTVNIQVEGIGDFTIRYNAYSGRAVQFDVESFAAACQQVTGNSLNYVRFDVPSSLRGTLYYNYSATKPNNTTVSSGTNYYRTSSYSRKISDVSFVPNSNFTGTLSFHYTGVASNNARYTGTIEIRVSSTTAQTVSVAGTSLPVSLNATSFYQACSQVLPRGLYYIEFTSLPAASQGVMYYNYAPPSPGTRVTTGTRYYYSGTPGINWLAFVPKAEYSGTVSIGYRAYDSAGLSATGTLNLVISSAGTVCHFRDMAAYTWAAPSVEFLYQSGIVRGTNLEQTEYSPSERITRCEFTVMLCRAFGLETAGTASFPDVRADEYYAKAVATARDLGIVTGSADGLFHPEEDLPRQEAMLMLYRAMLAAGYQLPSAGANLSAYSDGAQVSPECRTAVSVMVQQGVMKGDQGRLMPRDTLSRAEMAVVMHRVMTL